MSDNEDIKIDPKVVEQEMIEKAIKASVDPVEVSSTMYTLFLPKFKMGMRKLSSRARARVLNYLIEYPLNTKEIKLKNNEEKELVAMGHAVLESKFIMILSTMNDGMDELCNAANPDIAPDLTDEEKQELEKFMNPNYMLEFGKSEENENE